MNSIAQPKVSLSYNPTSGEFSLSVSETSSVTYTIGYDWQNVDATGAATTSTDALTNTKKADKTNKVTDTQVAGTVSSGDTYIHQVLRGVLNLSATTLDNKILNYEQVFKITDDKKIKIISQQSGTKPATTSAVLGATTSATPSAKVEPTIAKPSVQNQVVTQGPSDTEPTTYQSMILPATLGSVVLGIGIIGVGVWYRHKKKAQKNILTTMELPKL